MSGMIPARKLPAEFVNRLCIVRATAFGLTDPAIFGASGHACPGTALTTAIVRT